MKLTKKQTNKIAHLIVSTRPMEWERQDREMIAKVVIDAFAVAGNPLNIVTVDYLRSLLNQAEGCKIDD